MADLGSSLASVLQVPGLQELLNNSITQQRQLQPLRTAVNQQAANMLPNSAFSRPNMAAIPAANYTTAAPSGGMSPLLAGLLGAGGGVGLTLLLQKLMGGGGGGGGNGGGSGGGSGAGSSFSFNAPPVANMLGKLFSHGGGGNPNISSNQGFSYGPPDPYAPTNEYGPPDPNALPPGFDPNSIYGGGYSFTDDGGGQTSGSADADIFAD